ncbi:hypothetical protein ACWDA3_59170 [Nonomuraea rubra]
MAVRHYLLITEEAPCPHAGDGYTACQTCEPNEIDGQPVTWSIRLLATCVSGCGCVVQLDHVVGVHGPFGNGDFASRYDSPEEIADPALRCYAEALLASFRHRRLPETLAAFALPAA